MCVGGLGKLKFFDAVSKVDDTLSSFPCLDFSLFPTGYSNLGFKVIPGVYCK